MVELTDTDAGLLRALQGLGDEFGPSGVAEAACLMAGIDEALLGLATNEDLLRELICRFKMEQYVPGSMETVHLSIDRALILSELLGGLDGPMREYRTVDHG